MNSRLIRNIRRAAVGLVAMVVLMAGPMGCSCFRKCKPCCDKPCCKKAAPEAGK
jgi:hypothetical protein